MINHYFFEKIEKDENGYWWGYMGNRRCKVRPYSLGKEDDDLLHRSGYARCSPGRNFYVVKEEDWESLNE